MKVGGKHYRSVWPIGEDAFGIIDQTRLPHEFVTLTLHSAADAAQIQTGRPDLGFLGSSPFAAKTPDYEGWKSLDFLGFSRPNRDLSMGYEHFS